MSKLRKKFATLVNSEILSAIRALAETEGRQIQTLVDEAFADLIEKRENAQPRPHVMSAYLASLETNDALYAKLAE